MRRGPDQNLTSNDGSFRSRATSLASHHLSIGCLDKNTRRKSRYTWCAFSDVANILDTTHPLIFDPDKTLLIHNSCMNVIMLPLHVEKPWRSRRNCLAGDVCNGVMVAWHHGPGPAAPDSARHSPDVELTQIWIWKFGTQNVEEKPSRQSAEMCRCVYIYEPSGCLRVFPGFVYRPVSLTVFAGAQDNVWLVNCCKKRRVKVYLSIQVNINQASRDLGSRGAIKLSGVSLLTSHWSKCRGLALSLAS